MKSIQVIAKILVDETKPNALDEEHFKLAFEDVINTPNNDYFGIVSSEVHVSSYLISSVEDKD